MGDRALATDVAEYLDLTAREATVYLAVLESTTRSVQSIAEAAGTERTGTYDVLERLVSRGLVQLVRVGKRTTVHVVSLRTIREQLATKVAAVEAVLPRLETLMKGAVDNFSAERVSGAAVVDRFTDLVSTGFEPLRLTLGAISVADAADEAIVRDRLTPLSPLFVGRKTQVLVASALSPLTQSWMTELKRHLPCRRLPSPALVPSSQLLGSQTVLTVGMEGADVVGVAVTSPSVLAHERAVFEALWRVSKAMD